MSVFPGYAFAPKEVYEDHLAEFVEARKKVPEGAILVLDRAFGYNHNKFLPNMEVLKGLTEHQIAMLINGSPLPFGGRTEGSWIVIHTD